MPIKSNPFYNFFFRNVIYARMVSAFSTLLLLSFDIQSQSKFNIEYPYDNYIHTLHADEHTGYVWGITKDDVLLFDGKRTVPLQIDKFTKNQYKSLYTGAFLNNQYLFRLENDLVSIDFLTKEIKKIWDLSEFHSTWKTHLDKEDQSVWVIGQHRSSKRLSMFNIDNDTKVKKEYELPDFGIDNIFGTEYSFQEASGLFYLYGQYSEFFIFDKKGKEVELDIYETSDVKKPETCYVYRVDNKGKLWRTAGEKFELYDRETKSFKLHEVSGKLRTRVQCEDVKIPGRNIRFIHEDRKGRMWFGCEDSNLFCYDSLTDELLSFKQELVTALGGSGGNIKSLVEDKDGNLWGIKRGGIFKITEKERYFDSYLVDTDDPAHPLYENGNNPFINRVVAFYKEDGIERSKILSISEDTNGDLYFQDYRFNYRIKKGMDKMEVLPFFKESGNRSIYADRDIKLLSVWSSYYTFDSTLTLTKKSAPLKEINTFFRRDNGDLYVSGKVHGKGKRLFAKLNSETYEYEENYMDTTGVFDAGRIRVFSIDEDKDNHFWVGTNHGIIKLHAQEGYKDHFADSMKYKSTIVNISRKGLTAKYLAEDYIWIKSENEIGLFHAKTNSFKHYLHKEDIDIKSIHALLPIDKNRVWVGDNEGLFHYDFERNKMTRFYDYEGMGEGALVEKITALQDGRLAIGSENGLYIAHPDSLMAKKKQLELREDTMEMKLFSYSYLDEETEELSHNDFIMDSAQEIHINYNDKMLKFEYFINNHNSQDRQTYSYKLEGFNKDWSTRSKSNIAHYASIPPGKYNFMARGAPSGDNWTEEILSIPIIVHDAWYRMWWSYCLFTLLIFTILYGLFKYRVNQILKYQNLRTKISSDLHDDVGTLLSSLAMQSDVLSMDAPPEKIKKFEKFSSLSREAMDRMRDTVWAIDSRKDNMMSLINRMADYISDMYEDHHISIKFEHDKSNLSKSLAPDVRQNVYLIFKEALNNAMKYSNGDQVNIQLKQSSEALSMTIKDNGTVSEIKTSGLGISNMKMRAKRIKGSLTITNSDGFEVSLIVKK